MSTTFFSRFFKHADSSHPLGSDKALRTLVAGFDSSDSRRFLHDIDEHLTHPGDLVTQIGVDAAYQAISRLDYCAHMAVADLLYKFLSPHFGHDLNEVAWAQLDKHTASLLDGYQQTLPRLIGNSATTVSRNEQARGAVLALRAWALRKKLHRFRYRALAPGMWRRAHELLALTERNGLDREVVLLPGSEQAVTPLHTYLCGTCFDCLPLEVLTPQQMEVLDQCIASCAELDLNNERSADSTHGIDPAGDAPPSRLRPDTSIAATSRYFSTRPLLAPLVSLADRLASDGEVPGWLFLVPGGDNTKEAALRTAARSWGNAAQRLRGADRTPSGAPLKAVIGFSAVRNAVCISETVRKHLASYNDTGNQPVDSRLLPDDDPESLDFSFLAIEPAPGPASTETAPSLLQRIEADAVGAGTFPLEPWSQADTSDSGLGVMVSAVLSRYKISSLLAYRHQDSVQWSIGILRRIGRDSANKPRIGIESLGGHAISVGVRIMRGGPGETELDTLPIDAVLLDRNDGELLMPPSGAAGGRLLEVTTEVGTFMVRVARVLDRGEDYDRFVVVPVGPAPTLASDP